MRSWRSIIPAIIAALVVTATARADLMPVSSRDAGGPAPVSAPDQVAPLPASSPDFFLGIAGSGDPGLRPMASWPAPGVDEGPAAQAPPTRLLAEGQGSLSLCLYGLLGLGVFRSGSWVKKFSASVIPDWYHTGGPVQIGHSFAIAPDCRCSASVCCFVQPDGRVNQGTPKYHRGAIVSLWRQSQFTPAVLASCGPPSLVA